MVKIILDSIVRKKNKMEHTSNLNTPLSRTLKIGGLEAKNRFCIQPMECGNGDLKGRITEAALRRYQNLFRGGAGVIVMESVTLQYESRARENQLLLDLEDFCGFFFTPEIYEGA